MARVIEIVPYEAKWPAAFEAEAAALREVFGTRALAVEHIGSTAVPGLEAKPIIDVLVVLDSTDDLSVFSDGMNSLGYRVRGECLAAEIPGTPGRFYFSKDHGDVRTHQVQHRPPTGARSPRLPRLSAGASVDRARLRRRQAEGCNRASRYDYRVHATEGRVYEGYDQRRATMG
jgi:hypothetical protein